MVVLTDKFYFQGYGYFFNLIISLLFWQEIDAGLGKGRFPNYFF